MSHVQAPRKPVAQPLPDPKQIPQDAPAGVTEKAVAAATKDSGKLTEKNAHSWMESRIIESQEFVLAEQARRAIGEIEETQQIPELNADAAETLTAAHDAELLKGWLTPVARRMIYLRSKVTVWLARKRDEAKSSWTRAAWNIALWGWVVICWIISKLLAMIVRAIDWIISFVRKLFGRAKKVDDATTPADGAPPDKEQVKQAMNDLLTTEEQP